MELVFGILRQLAQCVMPVINALNSRLQAVLFNALNSRLQVLFFLGSACVLINYVLISIYSLVFYVIPFQLISAITSADNSR